MMNKENFPGPINLGNPSEISINELAKEIIDLVGSKSKLINKDLPIDDPKQRCPNIDIAKEKLGWKPSYSRQEGLKKTIKYFETILEKEKES
jgi:UDP-glucuronate decarboxylase